MYGEGVTSVSTFSEEQCQLLYDSRLLCQSPELFKPKDRFSEMRNKKAQE